MIGYAVKLTRSPGQMEQAVDHQMARMGLQRDAFLGRFACAGLMRQRDVAQQHRRAIGCEIEQFVALQHREAEHVGRLVLLAPSFVEFVDLSIAGEQDARFEPGIRQRRLGRGGRLRGPLRICHASSRVLAVQ